MPPGTGSRRAGGRLRRRSEFQVVFDGGRRASGRFVTILVKPNRLETDRLGIVATKKLGHAVQRNRAKRRIRELFRRHKTGHGASHVDVVVIPRRELLDAPFGALEADYQATLRRHKLRAR